MRTEKLIPSVSARDVQEVTWQWARAARIPDPT